MRFSSFRDFELRVKKHEMLNALSFLTIFQSNLYFMFE